MAKKPSGLGRGLDDLLEDNAMSKRPAKTGTKPLVEPKKEAVAVKPVAPTVNSADKPSSVYDIKPKALYETKPKTKSLKANFKNLNKR